VAVESNDMAEDITLTQARSGISGPGLVNYRTNSLQSFETTAELNVYEEQYKEARRELDSILPRFQRRAVCGRTFYLSKGLAEELKRRRSKSLQNTAHLKFPWENDFERLWKSSIYRLSVGPPAITEDDLKNNTTLFFILLDIEEPETIDIFLHNGIQDSMLPLSREAMLEMRPQLDIKNYTTMVERFLEKQPSWCPLKFDLNMEMNIRDRILPFSRKFPIHPEGQEHKPSAHGSTIWMVEVPGELVGDELKSKLPNAKRTFMAKVKGSLAPGSNEIVSF
jgi:hypothetical protein